MHFRSQFTVLFKSEGQIEAKFTFLHPETGPLT